MSWISDVKTGIKELDLSTTALRKFGLVVGSVFAAIAVLAWFKEWNKVVFVFAAVAGVFLLPFGALLPSRLKKIYIIWMTFAIAIGWVVSKVLLTIVFYLAVVPIGLLGRILGLPFVHLRKTPDSSSFWVDKKPCDRESYERMF